MRLITLILVMFLLVHTLIAQGPTKKQPISPAPQGAAKVNKPVISQRRTVVYRIMFVDVKEVAKAVNRELTTILSLKPKLEGFIVDSPIVLIPEVSTNSLLVTAKPGFIDKIAKIIRKIDKAQTEITIQLLIQEVENGKVTTLSRPVVRTLDGKESGIEIGTGDKSLRITLTPHVVRQDDEETTLP